MLLNTDTSTRVSHTTVKTQIDALLHNFYAGNVARAKTLNPAYHELWLAMQRLSQSGGKRVRPYVCLLAYQASGGNDVSAIMPVAAAQELLHASLLVHDDIIDHDYTRYGTANVAGQFRQRYRGLIVDPARVDHYSNSAALLAGDLLLSSAHQLIAQSGLPAEDIARSQQYLYEAVFSVAAGELLDSEASLHTAASVDALQIAELKTADYSFSVPLRTGAALAGASSAELAVYADFGRYLGIAYQLADDILGVFGDPEQTGKSNSSDITEGKHTYLLQMTLELADAEGQTLVRNSLGYASLSVAQLAAVRQVMETSGALARTRQAAQDHATRALQALDNLTLEPSARQAFTDLVAMATKRVV